jgi:hypothetical protein
VRRGLLPCLIVAALAGCGGDDKGDEAATPASVPSGGVAVVGDTPIEQERFERALRARLRGLSPLTPGARQAPVVDAPGFARCVARLRTEQAAADRKVPAGSRPPKPSDAQLEQNCQAQYDQARAATLSTLIQGLGPCGRPRTPACASTTPRSAGARAVRRRGRPARRPRRAGREGARALRDARRASGLTEDDVREQLRTQLVQQRLLERRTKDIGPPSDEDARAFYEKNPELFAGGRKPFQQVADEAREQLRGRRIQRAQVEFQNELQRRWRPRTRCAEGLVVAQCANGPAPSELPLPEA